MTVELCKSACAGFGYAYGGVENANTCQCGNTLPTIGQMPHSYCGTACKGNASETCGGYQYIEVYDTTSAEVSGPGHQAALGCYSDSPHGLTSYSFSSSVMTNALCMSSCKELGYSYAGTEAANTCYCGNSWTSTAKLPSSSCSSACSGNSTAFCGATNIISLLNATMGDDVPAQMNNWVGCYTDASASRTLGNYSYSTSAMTSSVCKNQCSLLGYSYAGVESANQCYCGTTIASPGSRVPYWNCATACSGNSSEACGGSYKLDIYTTTSTKLGTTATGGALGCYSDTTKLSSYTYTSSFMTPDICTRACLVRGYSYSGTTTGNVCRCGNTAPASLVTPATCATACTGDSTLKCGGTGAMSAVLISNSGITSGQFAVAAVNSTGYVGCYTDSSAARLMSIQAYSTTTSATTTCQQSCAAMGYAYSGNEYSVQCWCTNQMNATSGQYRVADSSCSLACPAGGSTPGTTCGASNIVAVYDTSYAPKVAASTVEGYTGCYAAGTFITSAAYSYTGTDVTAGLCRRTCRNKGYGTAGVTNGNVCVCQANNALLGASSPLSLCSSTCKGDATQTCGAASFVSVYSVTGAGSLPPAGYPANYVGCYADAAVRVMTAYSYNGAGMSSALCGRVCAAQGYTIYGTEAGNACYCSSSKSSTSSAYPAQLGADSNCGTVCNGLAGETCGGSYKLSVYDANWSTVISGQVVVTNTSTSAVASSSAVTSTAKSTSATASTATVAGMTSVSPQSSAIASSSKASSSVVVLSSTTSTATTSAATAKTWQFLGCYTDGTPRAMAYQYGASSAMTVALCEDACSARGYTYAGLEYASQCYCANSIASTLERAAESSCSMACAGDSTLKCGASYFMDIYLLATPGSVVSSASVAVSSIAASTSKVISAITAKATVAVAVNSAITALPTAVTSSLAAASTASLLPTAAVSSALGLVSAQTSSSPASSSAAGVSSAISSSSVKTTATSPVVSSATSVVASLTSSSAAASATTSIAPFTYGSYSYQYAGCIVDDTANRSVSTSFVSSSSLTYTQCAQHCAGSAFIAMESRSQCFCATTLLYNVTALESECSDPCSGDSTQVCGGSARLSVFSRVGGSASTSTSSSVAPATSSSVAESSSAAAVSSTSVAASSSTAKAVTSTSATTTSKSVATNVNLVTTVQATSTSASDCDAGTTVYITKTVTAGSTATLARKALSRHAHLAAKNLGGSHGAAKRSTGVFGSFAKVRSGDEEVLGTSKRSTPRLR